MIKTELLPNGVRIIMEKMPQVQSMAIGIMVRTGAVDETKKISGISHFVEHMMFKGTERRTARQIAGDIDKIGGQINAFTGKEMTCYYVKSVAKNYKKAAEVLVDMLENSIFAKEELDRERNVICEEIKMTKDTPDDLAHDTLITNMFKDSNLGNSILGTPSSLSRITRNVMKTYVENQYTKDSIVISVAGNFDFDDVCDYFQQQFTKLKAKKSDLKWKKPEYKHFAKSQVKDIQQAHICLGTKGITLDDERTYDFQVLNNILGGSMSSRLFQNIREQKGLAYSVYSSNGPFSREGYFEIYAGVDTGKIGKAIEGIKEELEFLSKESVSFEELNSSKEQLKAGYVFSRENTSARMMVNGKNLILLNKVFHPEEVLSGYDAVSADSLDDVKGMICDFNTYSCSCVSNKKLNLKKLMV
ncbi:MAG: pitrilysin family protein [Hornefia sp.]|nr:pitrilysin family protein [Hornefia sp.]